MENKPKEELDFNDLKKDPKRLFGLSYFYFLVVGVVLGGYYVLNFNVITRNNIAPVILLDSTLLVTDVPMIRSSVIPPVDVKVAAVPTKEAIAKGAALFKVNCVSCHGETGMGDGPTSVTLNPKPRNFHSPDGWINGRKISQMYKTLQEGIAKSGMASYNYLPADDRFALIHFVRTFATDFPVDSTADLDALEKTYQLSKGSVTPAQIPIQLAVQKIVAEHHDSVAIASARFTAAMLSTGRGAEILHRIVVDSTKAAEGLASLQLRTPDQITRAVTADPARFGLKPSAVFLNAEDWNAVTEALR
jgi:mono/diheme cytochrome c family protein